ACGAHTGHSRAAAAVNENSVGRSASATGGRDSRYDGPRISRRFGLSSKTSKTAAEASSARTQKRAADAARAMSDAQAEAKRIDENTARLRALRMARDAKVAAD